MYYIHVCDVTTCTCDVTTCTCDVTTCTCDVTTCTCDVTTCTCDVTTCTCPCAVKKNIYDNCTPSILFVTMPPVILVHLLRNN